MDKLSAGKMRQELCNRGHSIGLSAENIEKLSKNEVKEKLKLALETCSMCVSNDCECVVNGVPCMPDICGCMHKLTLSQECMNPEGKVVFNAKEVNDFRSHFIDVQQR